MKPRMFDPVLVLMVAFAGTTAPAIGQNRPDPVREPAAATTVDYRSARWLSDRKVVNNNGEEIASVSDLILDRGSGRIEYIVIKTGTVLGAGGRAVAIPYNSFAWEPGEKDRFKLASTPEQLKQFPEYSEERWKSMRETLESDKNTLHSTLAADAAAPSDPYAGSLESSKRDRVEGRVTKVERVRTSSFGEQVMLTVATKDGAQRVVALGPSWYVNSSPAAPMRGDTVIVDTLALPRDANQLVVGTHLKAADRELHLRDADGSPAWALKSVESGGRTYTTPYSRYLLQSDIVGMKVDCRGDDAGKVHDIVLDRRSGAIGFLSIDPNEKFLGIRDTKRLVPWSVATVTLGGTVRIDASKEMVLDSIETPSDLSALNSGGLAESVYTAFDVPGPRFEKRAPTAPRADDAWSRSGPIVAAIEKDSARAISGQVTSFTEVKFENGVQTARAMKIRTSGEDTPEELVLIGPAWYMNNQKPACQSGDSVTVNVCRTMIDGQRYWIARSIECKGNRVVLLDEHNSPAWVNKP